MTAETDKNKVDTDALFAKLSAETKQLVSDGVKTASSDIEAKVLAAINSTKKGGETEDDPFKWGQDEESDYISKKDLKEVLAKLVPEIQKNAAKSAKASVDESLSENSKKAEIDSKALKDFPMLMEGSRLYDKKFEEAVQKEVNRRVSEGRTAQEQKAIAADPYLIYNAAATVKATDEKWAISEKAKLKEENTNFNNSHSMSFKQGGSTVERTNSDRPNERQLSLASSMGLSKESLEKSMKRSS